MKYDAFLEEEATRARHGVCQSLPSAAELEAARAVPEEPYKKMIGMPKRGTGELPTPAFIDVAEGVGQLCRGAQHPPPPPRNGAIIGPRGR
ncbi:MAG: hypothetical protein IPJ77_21485 [Planctomycetes bacterium]|nr:hypothetical protein [Planctomycetota bacterium]